MSDPTAVDELDPFEVMAIQLRDTVRIAARRLAFTAEMALEFRPGSTAANEDG